MHVAHYYSGKCTEEAIDHKHLKFHQLFKEHSSN